MRVRVRVRVSVQVQVRLHVRVRVRVREQESVPVRVGVGVGVGVRVRVSVRVRVRVMRVRLRVRAHRTRPLVSSAASLVFSMIIALQSWSMLAACEYSGVWTSGGPLNPLPTETQASSPREGAGTGCGQRDANVSRTTVQMRCHL